MKEKFWDLYDSLDTIFLDFRSEIYNRLIRYFLCHMWVDSITMRMMIHKIGKCETKICLEEYDEAEKYWQKNGSPFGK